MRAIFVFLCALIITLSANSQGLESNNYVVYRGFVEIGGGSAYNLNTAQTISTVNMQALLAISTSHGVNFKNWFCGVGLGYNNPQRDNETQFLTYADFRYLLDSYKIMPSVGLKTGIIFDSDWIEKVQKYVAFSGSIRLDKKMRLGFETSVYSRPSRHFTANALVVVGYEIGK